MYGQDTSMGGSRGGAFPQTTWGLISQIHATRVAGAPPASGDALERLALRYWKPIYRYVRATWGRSNEDAKDATQAFLLWLLEGDALRSYAPDRGSFRNYLKLLLGRFVSHQAEALQRLKRGGGARFVSLDSEMAQFVADDRAADPQAAFERAWLAEVLGQAIARVRRRFVESGREVQFRAYEEYELAAGERPTYAEVGARLGIEESKVRNYLFTVRAEVRAEARGEISETTTGPEALEEEWRALFPKDDRAAQP